MGGIKCIIGDAEHVAVNTRNIARVNRKVNDVCDATGVPQSGVLIKFHDLPSNARTMHVRFCISISLRAFLRAEGIRFYGGFIPCPSPTSISCPQTIGFSPKLFSSNFYSTSIKTKKQQKPLVESWRTWRPWRTGSLILLVNVSFRLCFFLH